jgi:asparagine synthase (glutamine-hydrolysing)
MLALHLTRHSAKDRWQKRGCGFAAGDGVVEPIDHPALESFAVAAADELLVVVRERCATAPRWSPDDSSRHDATGLVERVSADRLAALETEAIAWPLQWTSVRVRGGDHNAVTIRSGPWGTAPLFLVESRGELWAHWDPSTLFCRLEDRSLDRPRVAHFLATFDIPYSRRTLLRDMYMLTERSTATWSSSGDGSPGLRIDYPEPATRTRPRTLKPGAEVESTFLDIIASSTRRWLGPGVAAASTLSGGLDSALVSAGAARLTGEGWNTCGLILPNTHRFDQIERRGELIGLFGFADQTIELAHALPLQSVTCGGTARPCAIPWEEVYYEAMAGLLRRVSQAGANVIFTGVGGDELCTMNRGEIGAESHPTDGETDESMPSFLTARARDAAAAYPSLDHAPRGLAAASTVEAVAFSSAMYLRQGMWPVHPLGTPELVRFCGALPAEWRANRTVARRALARLGCSARVTHGTLDNFAPALAHSLRTGARPMVESLFRNSRLADDGYLDPGLLLRDFSEWAERKDAADASVPFYAVAVTELMLQSLERAPTNGPST